MWMVIMWMQYILIALEMNIFQKKKKITVNKNIITNIYRIQACNSTMCGYFGIGFSDFMLKGKGLLEYTIFFYSNDYEKNDEIILKYFQ